MPVDAVVSDDQNGDDFAGTTAKPGPATSTTNKSMAVVKSLVVRPVAKLAGNVTVNVGDINKHMPISSKVTAKPKRPTARGEEDEDKEQEDDADDDRDHAHTQGTPRDRNSTKSFSQKRPDSTSSLSNSDNAKRAKPTLSIATSTMAPAYKATAGTALKETESRRKPAAATTNHSEEEFFTGYQPELLDDDGVVEYSTPQKLAGVQAGLSLPGAMLKALVGDHRALWKKLVTTFRFVDRLQKYPYPLPYGVKTEKAQDIGEIIVDVLPYCSDIVLVRRCPHQLIDILGITHDPVKNTPLFLIRVGDKLAYRSATGIYSDISGISGALSERLYVKYQILMQIFEKSGAAKVQWPGGSGGDAAEINDSG